MVKMKNGLSFILNLHIAEEEGFPEIATSYKMIAKVEKEHELRYRKLVENIEKNQVFEKGRRSILVLQKLRICSFWQKSYGEMSCM